MSGAADSMPRSHEQLIEDNVRISGEAFRLRGALSDLVCALRAGPPPPELLERAESVLGRTAKPGAERPA